MGLTDPFLRGAASQTTLGAPSVGCPWVPRRGFLLRHPWARGPPGAPWCWGLGLGFGDCFSHRLGAQLLPHSASFPPSPPLQPWFRCRGQWLRSPGQTLDRHDGDDGQMPVQRCPHPLRPHGLHQKGSEQATRSGRSLTVIVMVTGTLTDECSCLSCHADPWSCPFERGDLVIHPQKQVLHPKHPCLSLTKSDGVRGPPRVWQGTSHRRPVGSGAASTASSRQTPLCHSPRLVILQEGSRENQSWTHLPVRKSQCLTFDRYIEGLETQKEPSGSHATHKGCPTLKAPTPALHLPSTTREPRGKYYPHFLEGKLSPRGNECCARHHTGTRWRSWGRASTFNVRAVVFEPE